jgi:hypothetical protein
MAIRQFLREGGVFEPDDIKAMSMAFEDVCNSLDLRDPMSREVMALRIIELARQGERSPTRLRDRALAETGLAKGMDNTKGAA